ncbi:acyltransferase [Sphingomonas sp. PB2P19]|uniref:acyltransferase family protein n=1 Tax=Sphingomonas rhamnosi TaxID=3096156 RepID=UPI002FC9A564
MDQMPDAPHTRSQAAPAPRGTLWTVQVLRGVAALMVVFGHSQSAVGAAITSGASGAQVFVRSTLVPWGAGVDLFFVISGFIIVHASTRLFARPGARKDFIARRLIRIVPLYWLVTTLFLALLAAATLKGGDAFPGSAAILASYAFVPMDTRGDGGLFPVFDLGWTLNYEMLFYALLAVVVAWPRRRALVVLAVVLAVLVGVGQVVPLPAALWFWTRPIILDFGLGVAVGALVAGHVVLPKALRIAIAAVGIGVLLADPGHVFDGPVGMTVANAWPRVLLAGVPVAAVLAAALLGPEPGMPRAAVPFTRIGDASYSLYLFHPFALIAMEKAAQKLAVVRDTPGWVLVLVTVAGAILIALAAYRWIERPMTIALTAMLAPRRPTAPLIV